MAKKFTINDFKIITKFLEKHKISIQELFDILNHEIDVRISSKNDNQWLDVDNIVSNYLSKRRIKNEKM